jgi:YHS domain-containing protein
VIGRIFRITSATLLLTSVDPAAGQLPPEECLVAPGETPAATATHAGKTYAFRSAECAATFQTDPERYAQLYDALLEMRKTGTVPAAPRSPSLVPS